jgi:hypothetical protein
MMALKHHWIWIVYYPSIEKNNKYITYHQNFVTCLCNVNADSDVLDRIVILLVVVVAAAENDEEVGTPTLRHVIFLASDSILS